MSFYYTSDELIKSVKAQAFIPTTQTTFKDEDFLRFANQELSLGMVPSILQRHEDYFLWTEVIPLVQGVTKYSVPYRAIGNKLRDVSYQDTSGNLREMTRIGVGDLPSWQNSYSGGQAYAFYMQNNKICLVPENVSSNGGSLKITYYIRPNSLVMLKDIAVVSGIDRVTGVLTLSNLPTNFSLNQKYDFVKVKSPHRCTNIELTPLSINTTSKTVTMSLVDISSDLEVGDHFCIATQSAIPQIPSDLHVVLTHRVSARCLEALGDFEGQQMANQKIAELEVKMQPVINNRVEDAPRKISNRHSPLRAGRRGWGSW